MKAGLLTAVILAVFTALCFFPVLLFAAVAVAAVAMLVAMIYDLADSIVNPSEWDL